MSGTLTLPPGMPLRGKPTIPAARPSNPMTPDVFPGSYILQFNLARPINYHNGQGLDLAPGYEQQQFQRNHFRRVELSDQQLDAAAQRARWRQCRSESDADHVGPGGEIRLKIDVSSMAARFNSIAPTSR